MMKSSTRRCSFGSIQSSGWNASGSAPRGTCAAIWQGRSDTSKFSTWAAADSPATSLRHVASTPQANGVTMPRPVTTTRLIGVPPPSKTFPPCRDRGFQCKRAGRKAGPLAPTDSHKHKTAPRRTRRSSLAGGGLFEKLHGIADGDYALRLIVRNFDPELLFEGHHQLNRVERIRAQIVDEIGAVDNFIGFHAEMLHDDLLHALCDIAHFFASLLRRVCNPPSVTIPSRPRTGRQPLFGRSLRSSRGESSFHGFRRRRRSKILADARSASADKPA